MRPQSNLKTNEIQQNTKLKNTNENTKLNVFCLNCKVKPFLHCKKKLSLYQ